MVFIHLQNKFAMAPAQTGRKGLAKLANKVKLNALAASETHWQAKALAAAKRSHKKHAVVARKAKERRVRASSAESTQIAHYVQAHKGSPSVVPGNRALPPTILTIFLSSVDTRLFWYQPL
jgi:hypothetical protein